MARPRLPEARALQPGSRPRALSRTLRSLVGDVGKARRPTRRLPIESSMTTVVGACHDDDSYITTVRICCCYCATPTERRGEEWRGEFIHGSTKRYFFFFFFFWPCASWHVLPTNASSIGASWAGLMSKCTVAPSICSSAFSPPSVLHSNSTTIRTRHS
jgi:hypothetical protein